MGNNLSKELKENDCEREVLLNSHVHLSPRPVEIVSKRNEEVVDVAKSCSQSVHFIRNSSEGYLNGTRALIPGNMEVLCEPKDPVTPVITAFNSDKTKSLKVLNVGRYAKWLKSKNVKSIMLNDVTGKKSVPNIAELKLRAKQCFHNSDTRRCRTTDKEV